MYITRRCSGFRVVSARTLLGLALLLSLASAAHAKDNPSYTQVGHNISIGPNEEVSDLTCFGCSIRVRGQVAADVTVFGGDIRLDQAVKVAGDATVFAGQIRRDPQATISGDVTSMGGHVWLVPVLLSPFLILGMLIAFVIWLVQRISRPSMPAAAA